MSNNSVWYTSDIHIGHRKVAGIRGFWDEDDVRDTPDGPQAAPCPDEHDAWLADIWQTVMKPGDTIFILGDISAGPRTSTDNALDWLDQHKHVKKHLILGNHDEAHPMYRDFARFQREWMRHFESIAPFGRRKLLGTDVLMSHFPYASWGEGPARGGAEASRYNQYRLQDQGKLLLHGHTHGTERAHDNMFHVGVDAWAGHPVHQDQIIAWMESA